jgi:hypothetical protein
MTCKFQDTNRYRNSAISGNVAYRQQIPIASRLLPIKLDAYCCRRQTAMARSAFSSDDRVNYNFSNVQCELFCSQCCALFDIKAETLLVETTVLCPSCSRNVRPPMPTSELLKLCRALQKEHTTGWEQCAFAA